MKNKISFTYNPYTYFESYKNVLSNLRKHYVDSDVFIYIDSFRTDIQEYNDIASIHNCKFNIQTEPMFYINRNDSIEINEPKMMEWVSRIKYTCENTDSEWIMLLEDDVLIKRKIIHWPTTDVGTSRHYFRPGGGSIFRRTVFLESLQKVNVSNLIKSVNHASWAGDVLLEHIFKKSNIKHEKWIELSEPNWFDKTDHAVFHGFKDLHKLG